MINMLNKNDALTTITELLESLGLTKDEISKFGKLLLIHDHEARHLAMRSFFYNASIYNKVKTKYDPSWLVHTITANFRKFNIN
jgi:hypothetical protein